MSSPLGSRARTEINRYQEFYRTYGKQPYIVNILVQVGFCTLYEIRTTPQARDNGSLLRHDYMAAIRNLSNYLNTFTFTHNGNEHTFMEICAQIMNKCKSDFETESLLDTMLHPTNDTYIGYPISQVGESQPMPVKFSKGAFNAMIVLRLRYQWVP